MENKKLPVILESSENRDKELTDILDALKEGMKIHGESQYKLSANILWAKKAEEKRQNFNTRQHLVAVKIKESFPKLRIHSKDKDGDLLYDDMGHPLYEEIPNPYAQKAYDLVMIPVEDWGVHNRNDETNAIIMGILKWGDSSKEILTQKDEVKAEGALNPKKITQYFKKKKKEEVVMGDGK